MSDHFKPSIRLFYLFLSALSFSNLFASPLIDLELPNRKTYQKYYHLHKKFSRTLCKANTENTFKKLYREYLDRGHFLPMISGNIDRKTIQNGLKLLREKKNWLLSTKKSIQKHYSRKENLNQIAQIDELYLKMLENGKQRFLHNKVNEVEAKKDFVLLRSKFSQLVKKNVHFQAYRFPVNYFQLRKLYDQKKKVRREKNRIYFLRKTFEDGTYNFAKKNGDKQFRSVISTLFLRMNEKKLAYLPEDIRYDLEYILESSWWSISKQDILQRLTLWKERVEEAITYYTKILKMPPKKLKHHLLKRQNALEALKAFVNAKEAYTYEFWASKGQDMQALFVLETILYNEVGDIDAPHNLERKDVLQVVLNRLRMKRYNRLSKKSYIYKTLKRKSKEHLVQNSKWQNVMFQKGQFSFTYYFISSSLRIFCPDMGPRGKKIRRTNVHLAMDILKGPRWNFKALRYFSRASMIGRIDMTPLWSDLDPLPQRIGKKISGRIARRMRRLMKGKRYRYLNRIQGSNGKVFHLLQFDFPDGKKEAVSLNPLESRPKFFHWRNPHYFKYFSP